VRILRWLDVDVAVVPLLRTSSCLGDESDHWGHLLHHFVHGFCVCGRLPDDDVKGFCRHDEAHRLSPWPMYISSWWVRLTALKSSVMTAKHSLTH
jgi:hypothetical protein